MGSRLPFSRLFSSPSLNTQNSLEVIGVLKLIIQSAHIDGPDGILQWRQPNPSVTVILDDRQVETGVQAATYDPTWITSTFYLLVKSPEEDMTLRVHDQGKYRKHRIIGEAFLAMKHLLDSRVQLNVQLPFLKHHKRRGDLLCSMFYFPVIPSQENDSNIGVVRLTVQRAENLGQAGDNSIFSSRISALVARIRLALNAAPIHVTPPANKLEDGSAVWESVHDFLCFDKTACVLYIDVVDRHSRDPLLGHICVCLTDVIEAADVKRGPWPLSGSAAGRLAVSAEWKSLDLEVV
ncbi:tricalbin [Favolaschia claudopus]|uniref:Tricalbin n=1 Tax=Favolaschia claudopus TaxID=2862362 RepID=A0AAW0EJQ4_9AGAR